MIKTIQKQPEMWTNLGDSRRLALVHSPRCRPVGAETSRMLSQSDYVCCADSESTSKESKSDQSDTITNENLLNQINELKAQVKDDDRAEDIENRRPKWVFKQFESHWRANDNAESSLQPIRSAWNQFRDWMEYKDYQYLTDLTPRFPGRHDAWVVKHDNINKKKLSRSIHLSRIRTVIRYANTQGWVYPSDVPASEVWDEVKPNIEDDDKIRSDPLPPERGKRILNWVQKNRFGSRAHVLWILLFRYGFRVSAIRALDRDDLILSEPDDWPDENEFNPHLRLQDRPELGQEDDMGLPLKNKREELAARRVPLQPEDVEAFNCYVENGSSTGADKSRKEYDVPDDFGLYGLLTGEHNARLSGATIRERTHYLTCPTTFTDSDCQCDGCQGYRTKYGQNPYPSKIYKHCNETRSPHQVRHGAITSLLDEYGHSTVARIVGTSPDTLRDVYDRADEYRRMSRVSGDWLSN